MSTTVSCPETDTTLADDYHHECMLKMIEKMEMEEMEYLQSLYDENVPLEVDVVPLGSI